MSDNKTREDKSKALGLALDQIEKQFGKGSIMKLGESPHAVVETILNWIIVSRFSLRWWPAKRPSH